MSNAPRRVLLQFDPQALEVKAGEDLRNGLSGAAVADQTLWVASDEALRLEQLRYRADRSYGDHQPIDLADLPHLPARPKPGKKPKEIDVEGLHFDGNYLWLIGSHGLKRTKPKEEEKPAENVKRLSEVTADKANRFLFARIPVERDGVSFVITPGNVAAAHVLDCTETSSELTEALQKDFPEDENPLLPFFAIPGKDNGFDIEGLTLVGDRIFIGLRGPVLRGWAVILEVRVEATDKNRLKLRSFDNGRRARRHFLDLRGLGVRELIAEEDTLLMLAGPTADLDGPVCVFRWALPAEGAEDTFTWEDQLPQVLSIPFGQGYDHAEGMTLVAMGGERGLLVTYDQPFPNRMDPNPNVGQYFADFFSF